MGGLGWDGITLPRKRVLTAKRNQDKFLNNPITLRSERGATSSETEEEPSGREEETQESVVGRRREWPWGRNAAEKGRKTRTRSSVTQQFW